MDSSVSGHLNFKNTCYYNSIEKLLFSIKKAEIIEYPRGGISSNFYFRAYTTINMNEMK